MVNVKANFSSMYNDLSCDLCFENVIQSSDHLLDCSTILDNCPKLYQDDSIQLEQIFGDINSQRKAASVYIEIFRIKLRVEDNISSSS